VGLHKTDTTRGKINWRFSDDSNPAYAETLWAPGQPDSHRGAEWCAEMVKWGGTGETNRMNDLACATRRPYLCTKTLADIPDDDDA
jgi:hypothetical protein